MEQFPEYHGRPPVHDDNNHKLRCRTYETKQVRGTYFVVQEHAPQEKQCVVDGFVEDCKWAGYNSGIKVEKKDIIDSATSILE